MSNSQMYIENGRMESTYFFIFLKLAKKVLINIYFCLSQYIVQKKYIDLMRNKTSRPNNKIHS